MPETPDADATPADDAGTSTDSEALEDLFGAPGATTEEGSTTPADATAPDDEMPTTEEEPAESTSSSILSEPGGLASAEMRSWVDNTGSYSCNGRLISILDGHARLLKDNGRTTTVPLYRLSAGDLEFLHRQASASQQRDTLAQATGGADVAEALSAN
jgi:hypothetical protein